MFDVITAVGIVLTIATLIPVFLQMRKHPTGIHILFFTEMWERFSFYGMRGILVVYMTQHFLFTDAFANGEYGAYMSLIYLLPLVGGLAADRYLGTRKATMFGALLLVAGHLLMAVEQPPATQTLTYQGQTYSFAAEGRQDSRRTWLVLGDQRYAYGPAPNGALAIHDLPPGAPLPSVLPAHSFEMGVVGRQPFYVGVFFSALALIIMGVGFLKPNVSTVVGQLYPQGDPRRDAGFTLYYFGINLGAFWASVVCARLANDVGWWAGFGAAGIGMAYGWLVFVTKRFLWFIPGPPQLPADVGLPPQPEQLKRPLVGPISREYLIYGLALAGVIGLWFLVQLSGVVRIALNAASVAMLAYFIFYMIRKCSWIEAQRIILALILVASSVVFFTLFELAGSALNQFAERNTQLPARGFFSITSSQTQSFGAGFILLCAPAFALLWSWLAKHKLDPGDSAKFALALIQVGAGYLVLVWGAQYADVSARVPLVFLVMLYFLHTTGELCLSPVGLSAMTKLAPAAVVSTLMATWFLGTSTAQSIAALIAQETAQETVAGQVLDTHAALAGYVKVFTNIGWTAIWIGIGLAVLSPMLKYLAHQNVMNAAKGDLGKKPAPLRS